MPDYMSKITKIIQYGEVYGDLNDIWINGGYMLLFAFGSLVCAFITCFFVSKLASNFSANLRDDMYKKIQSFSMNEINKFSTASLITRTTNDIQQIQLFLSMGLQMLIKAPITAIWAIGKIAGKQWQWSLATAISVIIVLLAITIILALVINKVKRMQKLTDELNQTARENLTGLRVIKAYNGEDYQTSKFQNVNNEFYKNNVYTGSVLSIISPLTTAISSGLTLAIYWIGAFILNGVTLYEVVEIFSDMVVFISYGMQVLMAFAMLVMIFMMMPRAIVSIKRVKDVLNTECSIQDGKGVETNNEVGTVEFKNVSFKYPEAHDYVLKNINFKVNKGETIAFIGATGCGKSTIVNLVNRFYDTTDGEVIVDGNNVKDYKKDDLNQKIAYISQKATLFSGTINSNINFGDNNASIEKVNKAVDISQSKEFVESKENKIESHVAQNGSNFSGGQKQRLSIARAIARDAEIYIFDDTFSALDFKTDKKLRDAIKKEMNGVTSLIVAQRIGTIKDADQIFVLEDGEIVGHGKHNELLKTCPTYLEIAKSQLSEEELGYEEK